MRKANSN